MTEAMPGLDALCAALREGDPETQARKRAEFISRNWALVSTLDRIAGAEAEAGRHAEAARKLRLIEELVPEPSGYAMRRLNAELHAGVPGTLEAIVAAAPMLKRYQDVYHAMEMLLGQARVDLAAALIEACRAHHDYSDGVIAVVTARLLESSGCLGPALGALDAEMATEQPDLTALRCRYTLQERLLRLMECQQTCARAALLYGHEREIHFLAERLNFFFEFDELEAVLRDVVRRHPEREGIAATLLSQSQEARAPADAALAEHGPAAGASADAVYEALLKSNTPPSRVLWGKQALVALLREGRLNEADFIRFGTYLPNWEHGRARWAVLGAALRDMPGAVPVRVAFLHYLITHGAYGDAAAECAGLLRDVGDDDSLFQAVMLLRLERAGVCPSFLRPELSDTLLAHAFARRTSASPGFRCVMHDHFVALGADPEPWPDDGLLVLDHPDATGFKRLFAVTTGRLRQAGTRPVTPRPALIRPVFAVSGQLRGFESTWASLHEHLAQPARAPLVLSVWDRSTNAIGRHAGRLERALPPDVTAQLRPEERFTDTFERAYPETYRLLFGSTMVDADTLRILVNASACSVIAVETESEDMIARLLPAHVSPNMLKMYYKFARLEQLIRAEETRTGNMFSHVIWSRPDCAILRHSPEDLQACLSRYDLPFSSFTTESSFGDYVMVLPRQAFAALATIFPRVVGADATVLMPWRPARIHNGIVSALGAFGGPDVIFDVLLAAGYLPLARIPRIQLELVGRTPGVDAVRQSFDAEHARRQPH